MGSSTLTSNATLSLAHSHPPSQHIGSMLVTDLVRICVFARDREDPQTARVKFPHGVRWLVHILRKRRFHALLACSIPFIRSLADSAAQSSYIFHGSNLRCGATCKEGTPLRSASVCKEHQVSQTARPPCKEHRWQRPAMKDSPL